MAGAFTRERWNEIIRQVNDLATNPDEGCDPVDTLEEVGPNHRWAKSDIRQVHDKLIEICANNSFGEIKNLWLQSTIDEIQDAIDAGWCDCDPCDVDDETIVLFDQEIPCVNGGQQTWGCDQPTSPCADGQPDDIEFDWYSAATALTGFGTGVGGTVAVTRRLQINGTDNTRLLYFNHFNCDGTQQTPLPPPILFGDGTLRFSSVAPAYYCTECTVLGPVVCFLGFCIQPPCVFGIPLCGSEEAEAAAAESEAGYAECLTQTRRVTYTAHKIPGECRECCEDGTGFKPADCPGEA